MDLDFRGVVEPESVGLRCQHEGGVFAAKVFAGQKLVPDEQKLIAEQVVEWSKDSGIDVVLATGGTGVTGRDVTPEAFESVYDKSIPGFGEIFHWVGVSHLSTEICLPNAEVRDTSAHF